MDVARGVGALPLSVGPSVVTIGFFDGVHRGHRAVLVRTVEAARERGLRAVAVTFDRHPREILTPDDVPRLLTTVERKASLIDDLGVDALVVLEFTEELSRWTPEDFMSRVLADGLSAAHVVVGTNFTFGHRALGTLQTLSEQGRVHGFTAEGVGLLDVDGRRISSSSVRQALAEGDLDWPRTALGRRFVLDGEVVAGHGRGRDLGFPTANLRTRPRLLLPGKGIYAGRAELRETAYAAAISVGTNPTFGVEPLHVEAYLLEYDGDDMRGDALSVEFWARLRDEERFESPDALARAIADDVARTREIVRGQER